MPRKPVVFFMDDDGMIPIFDWLDGLVSKAQIKCLAKLRRLEELGHELRRPELTTCETASTSSGRGSKELTAASCISFMGRKLWLSLTESRKSVPFPRTRLIWPFSAVQLFDRTLRNTDFNRKGSYGTKEPF
jgi:hypothetical protein